MNLRCGNAVAVFDTPILFFPEDLRIECEPFVAWGLYADNVKTGERAVIAGKGSMNYTDAPVTPMRRR